MPKAQICPETFVHEFNQETMVQQIIYFKSSVIHFWLTSARKVTEIALQT